MRTLPEYVRQAGLWFTVADTGPITDEHVARVRSLVEGTIGPAIAPPADVTG